MLTFKTIHNLGPLTFPNLYLWKTLGVGTILDQMTTNFLTFHYGGRGGEVQKIYSRKGKLNEKNSCTPINPEQYSCYGLKKIHTRNLITKKSSCGWKIPHITPPPPTTPHNYSNCPFLSQTCLEANAILIGFFRLFLAGLDLNLQWHPLSQKASHFWIALIFWFFKRNKQ